MPILAHAAIRLRGWTQAQAAAFFDETQPRISNLLKGEINRFSIDKLVNMLARTGIRVRLETERRAARGRRGERQAY
jgi:predicted XRE-type DNA-binding protein